MPGVTDRMKVQELRHYFEGPASQLIEHCLIKEDSTAGFRDALSTLNQKFIKKRQSALELIADLLTGDAITADDTDSFLGLYAMIKTRYCIATSNGMASQFENEIVVNRILSSKLSFLAHKWVEKCVDADKEQGRQLTFDDFLVFLNERHDFYVRHNAIMRHVSFPLDQMSASTEETWAEQEAESVSDEPNCVVCGEKHHLEACDVLPALDVEALTKLFVDEKACFRCGSLSHIARRCDAGVRCSSCFRPHLTGLCKIQVPPVPPSLDNSDDS